MESAACTTACTGEAKNQQNASLEVLAAMLLNLSADDRANLAEMLIMGRLSEGR